MWRNMPFLSRGARVALLGGAVVAVVVGGVVAARVLHTDPRPAAAAATAAPCGAGDACQAHALADHGGPAQPVRGKPRMLVFSSRGCPVCQRMAPSIIAAEKACGAEADVMHVDLDDDAGEGLAALYGVPLLPSFVSVDADGHEVSRLVGFQPQERIEQALEEIRGTRCAAADAPVRASGRKG
jgi:thiol-disulfide isomerase/thioredoxin